MADPVDFEQRLRTLARPGAFAKGLLPAQAHVLGTYAQLAPEVADVGIELPTGEGKTLIGLLIADLALDDGMSVAYLTGTKQLTDQVREQARDLPALAVHAFSGGNYPGGDLLDYHDAQAVGAMNYWVYFNHYAKVRPADVVIFDDAHLAEQPLSGMFTLRIERTVTGGREVYEAVCDLVLQQAPDAYPTLKALRDGAAPAGSPPELVAFNDWAQVADNARTLIENSPFAEANTDARFAMRAVGPYLTRCGVLVGPSAIEIRPYHPPTQTVAGYSASTRRVYLSATLGRSGDLQRRLGIKPVTAIETPAQLRRAATGRRTFVINPGSEPALGAGPLGFALEQTSKAVADGPGRVAWLCSSNAEADTVHAMLTTRSLLPFRFRAGDDDQFERWRVTTRAHLVTAGRYDGLDLEGDTCRLVIVPSVPAGSTEFERFAVAYLSDASFMRHRVGQRVTQALGRANRAADDSGLYLGLDPAFSGALSDPSVYNSLGTEIRDLVRQALDWHGDGWLAAQAAADQFWATHRTPPAASPSESGPQPGERPKARPGRRQAAGGASAAAGPNDSAGAEVEASTLLWLGDFAGAAAAAAAAADLLAVAGEPEHSAFWRYVAAHAHFARGGADVAAARAAIASAIEAAPRTAWFVRLHRVADELAGKTVEPTAHDALFLAWDDWIRESSRSLRTTLAQNLGWLRGTHDQRAAALTVLGRLCGASADRPPGQSATDTRWVWAGRVKGQRRAWEVKSGQSDTIPRSAVNQLLGQIREEQQLNPRANVVGCLLSDVEVADETAQRAAGDDIALVHTDFAIALYERMADLFTQYLAAWGSGTTTERGAARSAVEPRLPRGRDWLATLLAPSSGRVLHAQDAGAAFPGP
jgi:hypothetical protein